MGNAMRLVALVLKTKSFVMTCVFVSIFATTFPRDATVLQHAKSNAYALRFTDQSADHCVIARRVTLAVTQV
jgi:hypothetical protein